MRIEIKGLEEEGGVKKSASVIIKERGCSKGGYCDKHPNERIFAECPRCADLERKKWTRLADHTLVNFNVRAHA